ncbi:hypothetical protein Aperf_G00000063657 [Anoplocephala perfoliata]
MNLHGASCLILIVTLFLHFSDLLRVSPIGEYEALDYPILNPPPSRSKRSANHRPTSFSFNAFGLNFSLVLFRDDGVLSPTAILHVGGQTIPLSSDDNLAYPVRGYIKSHPKSLVFGSVLNGVFRGTIAFNANSFGLFVESPLTVEDVYFIEPAGNYLPNPAFHSVIYRASGTTGDDELVRKRRGVDDVNATEPSFCGHSKPEISQRLREMSQPALGSAELRYFRL